MVGPVGEAGVEVGARRGWSAIVVVHEDVRVASRPRHRGHRGPLHLIPGIVNARRPLLATAPLAAAAAAAAADHTTNDEGGPTRQKSDVRAGHGEYHLS